MGTWATPVWEVDVPVGVLGTRSKTHSLVSILLGIYVVLDHKVALF